MPPRAVRRTRATPRAQPHKLAQGTSSASGGAQALRPAARTLPHGRLRTLVVTAKGAAAAGVSWPSAVPSRARFLADIGLCFMGALSAAPFPLRFSCNTVECCVGWDGKRVAV